jgi:hypothetical protein
MTEFKAGDRVKYIGSLTRRLVDRLGTVVDSEYQNVQVRWDGSSETDSGVYPHNVVLVEEGKSDGFVSLDEAWKVGNVIEFTVDVKSNDGLLSRGCQQASISDAQPFIQKYTKKDNGDVELTVRGKITSWTCGYSNCGDCAYVGFDDAGVQITKPEARDYGLRNFVIISEPENVKAPAPVVEETDVTLAMTALQARALYSVLGILHQDSDIGNLWNRLDQTIGFMRFEYQINGNNGARQNSLRLQKKADVDNDPF